MEDILIVTDCANEKRTALKGVCIEHFGLNGFEIQCIENSIDEDTPLSFEALTKTAGARLQRLRIAYAAQKDFVPSQVYYATLQKGFLYTSQNLWLLAACALFGKDQNTVPALAECIPLSPKVNGHMNLPKEKWYEKFTEVYPGFPKSPLVTITTGISEIDWYKQAFRNCVKIGK